MTAPVSSNWFLRFSLLALSALTVWGCVKNNLVQPPGGQTAQPQTIQADCIEALPIQARSDVNQEAKVQVKVLDDQGRPVPRARVEWVLSRDGVGEIVSIHNTGNGSPTAGFPNNGLRPQLEAAAVKVDNNYAITYTDTESGTTYVTINSTVEGFSSLSAYAPQVRDGGRQKIQVVKEWFDINVDYPKENSVRYGSSSEVPVRLSRISNGKPLAGFRVTFEVVSGPPATLSSTVLRTLTGYTDGQGYVRATLLQPQVQEGANEVRIHVGRPGGDECCTDLPGIPDSLHLTRWIPPELRVEKRAPEAVGVGEEFDYEIEVSNTAAVEARGVEVTDFLPARLAYVTSDPPVQVKGSNLFWKMDRLAAGGSRSIRLKVRAIEAGDPTNCVQVLAEDGRIDRRSCVTTQIYRPELVVEQDGPSNSLICDEVLYTVRVRNAGTGPARQVRLLGSLPNGMTSQDPLNINVGALEPGESKTFQIHAKATAAGTYEFGVRATGQGDLQAQDSVTTQFGRPRLGLALQVVQPEMPVSLRERFGEGFFDGTRPITYRFDVANLGDGAARNLQLVHQLPQGVQLEGAAGADRDESGDVTWPLGVVDPGEHKTVEMTFRVADKKLVELAHSSLVRAYCADDQSENGKIGLLRPAIGLVMTDLEDTISVGERVFYCIRVTNQGATDDSDLKIEAQLPEELSYVCSSGPHDTSREVEKPAGVEVEGRHVTYRLPTLPAGESAFFTLQAQANAPGVVLFEVHVSSDNTIEGGFGEKEQTTLCDPCPTVRAGN